MWRLILIFLLALSLRLYKLSSFPPGFHVDEVKVGWNAYSILKTGRDDWGHTFKLHYNTFGDERPTGYFYATVPSIAIFGLTEFAVRFPPALFGSLTTIALFFLTYSITRNKNLSLASALMLTLSPWHISLSRASSEGIIALLFFTLGLYYFLSRRNFLSFIFLSLPYFFYHPFRLLTVPMVAAAAVYLKRFPRLLIPLFALTLIFATNPAARGRFSQVSIFNDPGVRSEIKTHNKLIVYVTRFISEYAQYISSKFYISLGEAKPIRYATVQTGTILYTEFALLLIGLCLIARKKLSPLPLIFLLVSPLATALTTEDSPNLHRSLLMLPFVSIISAAGLRSKTIFIPALLLLILNFTYFWNMYTVYNPKRDHITVSRNSGAKELIAHLSKIKNKYTHIVLTNSPDSLYPWYAFYTKPDPTQFNSASKNRNHGNWSYQNIIFTNLKCPSNFVSQQHLALTLAVNAEGCGPDNDLYPLDEIKRESGGTTYTFWISK